MRDEVRFPDVLSALLAGNDLDDATTSSVMEQIMDGNATPAQVAGLLMALRMKGETGEEIAGLVRSMRSYALPVRVDGPLVDTCGTGGDRAGTFNVSTVSAIVVAGAGAKVAKHGNRAASGKCGSADLLEAWGVVIDLPPEGVEACIEEVGIGFCFAPKFHPAMRHVAPARRELGVPTVLARLGSTHALVFHGHDGLDELTTTGPSTIWEIRDGAVEQYQFDPADHGIARATLADLRGGEVDVNLRIANQILDGVEGAPRDIVVVGAAAALRAADHHDSWDAAIAAAKESIDSGSARRVRDEWVKLSSSLAA